MKPKPEFNIVPFVIAAVPCLVLVTKTEGFLNAVGYVGLVLTAFVFMAGSGRGRS